MKRVIETRLPKLTYRFHRIPSTFSVRGDMQKMDKINTQLKSNENEKMANLNFKVERVLFRSYTIMARELEMKNKAFLVELFDSYVLANAERTGSRSPEMQRRFAELQNPSEAWWPC